MLPTRERRTYGPVRGTTVPLAGFDDGLLAFADVGVQRFDGHSCLGRPLERDGTLPNDTS